MTRLTLSPIAALLLLAGCGTDGFFEHAKEVGGKISEGSKQATADAVDGYGTLPQSIRDELRHDINNLTKQCDVRVTCDGDAGTQSAPE